MFEGRLCIAGPLDLGRNDAEYFTSGLTVANATECVKDLSEAIGNVSEVSGFLTLAICCHVLSMNNSAGSIAA